MKMITIFYNNKKFLVVKVTWLNFIFAATLYIHASRMISGCLFSRMIKPNEVLITQVSANICAMHGSLRALAIIYMTPTYTVFSCMPISRKTPAFILFARTLLKYESARAWAYIILCKRKIVFIYFYCICLFVAGALRTFYIYSWVRAA